MGNNTSSMQLAEIKDTIVSEMVVFIQHKANSYPKPLYQIRYIDRKFDNQKQAIKVWRHDAKSLSQTDSLICKLGSGIRLPFGPTG